MYVVNKDAHANSDFRASFTEHFSDCLLLSDVPPFFPVRRSVEKWHKSGRRRNVDDGRTDGWDITKPIFPLSSPLSLIIRETEIETGKNKGRKSYAYV